MKTKHLLINVVLLAALLLASCVSSDDVRVGELRTESKSIELGDAKSVDVNITIGAGDLKVTSGAEKLLEADFTYNVAKLKPEVEFTDSALVVQHPDVRGYRTLQDITDFRNEWDLRLNNDVPMNLSLEMGAGTSDLQLAGLSLTDLDIILGAGKSTVDLSGGWTRDLDATINTGAANITVRLPRDVGVRVEVEAGVGRIEASGLKQDGYVYTNEAYGTSEVTLQISIQAGIGQINLEVEEPAQPQDELQSLLDQEVEKQDILGMVMAVRLADGTVIWGTSGYISPAGNERWSANTPSLIGSITKTFTAVVVMQLVEEGKLSLDDTVDTWFPEQPNGEKITVRMLLSHTSGLAGFSSAWGTDLDKWSRDWKPEELIAEANKAYMVGKPGSSIAHYSNTNYIMLGRIIEKVTGNSWDYEVKSRIIQPLDLKDTTCATDDNKKEVAVPVYLKTSDGYLSLLDHPWYSQVSASVGWAAGGIASSASDLMTFASALFDGRLVSKETLDIMAQPVGTGGDGRTWALGGGVMEVEGYKAFAMGGDSIGYHAFFIGTLDGKFIVTALVNTNEGNVESPSMTAIKYFSQQIESK